MSKIDKIKKSKIELIPLYQELDKSKNDNLKLVMLANTFLELLVNILIEEKLKNSTKVLNGNEFTYSIKLLILNELNIINDNLYESILVLKKMRDRAAHQINFEITEDEIINLPKIPMNNTYQLYQACIFILGSIWNTNKDYFIKYFNL